MTPKEKKADEIADETRGWIESAVSDIAYSTDPDDFGFCWGEEWAVKIQNAKKHGVQDIKGWLADEMYDDADLLRDLLGDHIFDGATQVAGTSNDPDHSEWFIVICQKMLESNPHQPMRTVLEKFILEKRKRVQALKEVEEIHPEDLEAAADYLDRLKKEQ